MNNQNNGDLVGLGLRIQASYGHNSDQAIHTNEERHLMTKDPDWERFN